MMITSTICRGIPGIVLIAAAALAISCAGRSPEVLTATPDEVAIEFSKTGELSDATEVAQKECEKHGRIARFWLVKTAATPSTRVAKYRCVSPDIAAASATDPQELQRQAEAAAQAAARAAEDATASATAAAEAAADGTPEQDSAASPSAADSATSAAESTEAKQ